MAFNTPLHDQAVAAGAAFTEESGWLIPAHFGDWLTEYQQARSGVVLADQSHRGKIEVRGADAARFLHNLTTNDLVGLPPRAGCEAFLTTAKAKVVAYLLIYHAASTSDGPVFLLDVAPNAAERVIQYLDRYRISEQVEFVNHTTNYAQLHVAGPRAPACCNKHSMSMIFQPNLCGILRFLPAANPKVGSAGMTRWGQPGYDLVCAADSAASIWQRLTQAGARPAGRDACEILRIEAGLPREGADIDENTFAPEVGRIAQTICYTKGCYLGQESIVMARDRGQVNRSLVGVKISTDPVPHGSLLFAGGKEVGRVTSSVHSPRLGMAIGLAYVRRGHQEPGTKLEVEAAGSRSPTEVISLPI